MFCPPQLTIQVNHCRNPSCKNYGVPARTQRQRPGSSPERARNYKVQSTNKGPVPAIHCPACNESPPILSNDAIAAEVRRLLDEDRLWTPAEHTAYCNAACGNRRYPIGLHPGTGTGGTASRPRGTSTTAAPPAAPGRWCRTPCTCGPGAGKSRSTCSRGSPTSPRCAAWSVARG